LWAHLTAVLLCRRIERGTAYRFRPRPARWLAIASSSSAVSLTVATYLRATLEKLRRTQCTSALHSSPRSGGVVLDDDLDWEFVFDSRLGNPTGTSEEPLAKKSKRRFDKLPVLHPDAAGIDVGASELFVAVSADRDPQPVGSFPTFTRDLNALADWLQQCGIRSVAMESTSVYWIPV
jgi:hypothetical protein